MLCCASASADDEGSLVVHRGELAFVLMNRFPYASGHVMVAPVRHVGVFGELTDGRGAGDPPGWRRPRRRR